MQIQPWQMGAFVRKLRLERGLTQRQLAHLAGDPFEEREIRRLERGTFGAMRPDRLELILAILDSDLRALYRWTLLAEEMSPLATEWQIDLALVGQQPAFGEPDGDLAHARERLHAAMVASHEASNRSTELLAVSRQLLDWRTSAPATGRVLSSQC